MTFKWNNDYNCSAHTNIIKALAGIEQETYNGYGLDEWCEKASAVIKDKLNDHNVDIHFLVGGTQTNVTVIDHILRPWEAAVCVESGHINVHETGALEHSGHKCITVQGEKGKLTADALKNIARAFSDSDIKEHVVEPKLVYISEPTELGTVYSKAELLELKAICRQNGYYLFIDGARLGYGLAATDVAFSDLPSLCDVFYIGGTKCGAMFGEAVVFTGKSLSTHFRSSIKQNGGMLAKGWLLGLQFFELFKDNLYFDITKKAVNYAQILKNAFVKHGVKLYIDSPTNQLFVMLNDEQLEKLSQYHQPEVQWRESDGQMVVRFCTSWSTTEYALKTLLKDIDSL